MRSIAISSSGDADGRRLYPDANGVFNKALYFNFNDGKVKFDTNDVDNANENYGSVSGFFSKSLLGSSTTLIVWCCVIVRSESNRLACDQFHRLFLAVLYTSCYRAS